MMGWLPARSIAVIGYAAWCGFTLLLVGDALRHNDEAAYINGALQIAAGEVLPWHATFFNYDKQFASYWLIAGLLQLFTPDLSVFVTNYAQAVAFCLSLGAFLFYKLKGRYISLTLPLLLCPILVLSIFFFETSLISLIFFIAAASITSRHSIQRQGSACVLIAIAAACRADVVLAVPALLLSEMSRRNLWGLLTSRFAWAMSLCSIIPPLAGKLLTPAATGMIQAEPSPFKVVAAFIIFALGLGIAALLTWASLYFLSVSAHKSRWRLFYIGRALAPLIPFVFYVFQLQTPHQFFLTVTCFMFTLSDRRWRLIFWWLAPRSPYRAGIQAAICASIIAPWFIGIRAPTLARAWPVIQSPQDFPTSHGHFPMGAYFSYAINGWRNDYLLDHNERIFRAAKLTDYQVCEGKVQVLNSPMYNYIELAVRLRNLPPNIVYTTPMPDCPIIYADARSLILNTTLPGLLDYASLVNPFDGQAIVGLGRSKTNFGILLRLLSDRFRRREFEFYAEAANEQFEFKVSPNGGAIYAVSSGNCEADSGDSEPVLLENLNGVYFRLWEFPPGHSSPTASVACRDAALVGQVAFTFPVWVGK